MASIMWFRALRVFERSVQVEYATDDGSVRLFDFPVAPVPGDVDSMFGQPPGWRWFPVPGPYDDGGVARLVRYALTLSADRLPVDAFLEAVDERRRRPETDPGRADGARLSWVLAPWSRVLRMDRGLAEEFRVLLLACTVGGREFSLHADGRSVVVKPGARPELERASAHEARLHLDGSSAQVLATWMPPEPGTMLIPLGPGWDLAIEIVDR